MSNTELAPSKQPPISWSWLFLLIAVISVVFFGLIMGPRIEVTPGPWEDIAPGTPRPQLNVKVRVVKSGQGRKVEAGDLVRLAVRGKFTDGDFHPVGEFWVWIASRHDENADIYPNREGFSALLLNLRAGDVITFDDANNPLKDKHVVDSLPANPIGNEKYFSSWKNGDRVVLRDARSSSQSQVEILSTCKSKVQRRIVHLFDDSTIFVCGGLSISCGLASSAREGWVEEGRIEAQCPDGSVATFRYGPKGVRIKEWGGPVNSYNYFQEWILKEWRQKTPAKVQLQPPEK